MEYREYLKTDHWKSVRKKKTKNGRELTCEICRADGQVDIHHIQYTARGKSILFKEFEPEHYKYLKRLCRDCHFLAHTHFDGKVYASERGKILNLLLWGYSPADAFPIVATKKYGALRDYYVSGILPKKAPLRDLALFHPYKKAAD